MSAVKSARTLESISQLIKQYSDEGKAAGLPVLGLTDVMTYMIIEELYNDGALSSTPVEILSVMLMDPDGTPNTDEITLAWQKHSEQVQERLVELGVRES